MISDEQEKSKLALRLCGERTGGGHFFCFLVVSFVVSSLETALPRSRRFWRRCVLAFKSFFFSSGLRLPSCAADIASAADNRCYFAGGFHLFVGFAV